MSDVASSSPKQQTDIAIVGCGVLGTSLCKQLLSSADFKSASVTGITKTSNRHESIKEAIGSDNENFQLATYDDVLSKVETSGKKFSNVVFCAPPSGFDDYPAAVKDAIDNIWAGSNSGGSFVFTSSGGIYGPGNGETVNEQTQLPESSSPRILRLVNAEEACLSNDGACVLRLAGLYTLERGAHNYWLEKSKDGIVKVREDGIVNLLHYDDAAGSCLAALKKGPEVVSRKTFLISDGNPTTRKGICESALKSKRYSDSSMPIFLVELDEDGNVKNGGRDGKGKIYDGTWTNSILDWEPMYSSFDKFMSSEA